MRFIPVSARGISQISYLIGDDSTGEAAVIDPRPDCEIYLRLSEKHGLSITHLFETHIHADFMSGARELAARLGGRPAICASGEGDAEYGFDLERLADGDHFEFGATRLTVRHTPGHTPEHIAFELAEKERPDSPWGVLTGDSLFVGSAGRPDLLDDDQTEELAEKLFRTLREYYLGLDDGVMIFPCHGAGSACGADIGDRPMSTIGYERRFNDFLQYDDLNEFKKFVIDGAPPQPAHYSRLKKVNSRGPEIIGGLPKCPGLPADAFREVIDEDGVTLLDTRDMHAFGGGHIPGAINIGDRPMLSNWAGDMLDPEHELLLVMDDDRQIEEIVRYLWRVGITRFRGYLAGGMKSWNRKGWPLNRIEQVTVDELNEHRDEWQTLDVRAPSEWKEGHVPGAVHHYVAEMRDGVDELDGFSRDKTTAVYCGSGYRASIAASMLEQAGYSDVRNVPGSWEAWTERDLPVSHEHTEDDEEKE
ncbi:MAG: rhodanese-like domain-containing protein [Phycisphaerales bacterium]